MVQWEGREKRETEAEMKTGKGHEEEGRKFKCARAQTHRHTNTHIANNALPWAVLTAPVTMQILKEYLDYFFSKFVLENTNQGQNVSLKMERLYLPFAEKTFTPGSFGTLDLQPTVESPHLESPHLYHFR